MLPVENLTGDASLDWMGIALANMISEQLVGHDSVHSSGVEDRNHATGWRATQVLSGYFTADGESLDVRLVLRDRARSVTLKTLHSRAATTQIIPLAGEFASEIVAKARPYGTASLSALQAFSESLTTQELEKVEPGLRQALETDPGYDQAYLALAQLLLSKRDHDGIQALLAQASEQADKIDPIDQARLFALQATAAGDPQALQQALENLARLTPADSDLAQRTANTFLASKNYSKAADWFRAAATAEPGRSAYWNTLGYAQAWSGDLAAARGSLERYRELEPANPNVLDSLGEVHLRFKRFDEAARYFLQSYDADPSFRDGASIRKAAIARFHAGDRDAADALVQQFVAERELTEGLEFQLIRWRYFTGRRETATEEMQALAAREGVAPEIASMAQSLLAVWFLDTGRAEEAAAAAEQAVRLANTPSAQTWAALASFFTKPSASPEEWEKRASEAFPDPRAASLRVNALAAAMLFSGHFAEAVPLLQQLSLEAAPFNEDLSNLLLAWALEESGRPEEAKPLLAFHPVVQPGQEPLLHSLLFRGQATKPPNSGVD